MTVRATRRDWLVFLALGLMWGSSYLFIKLAVDSFGTFTLISLRLLAGALLLWVVVRLTRTPLPRDRRTYGHLLVMAVVNVALPFALITWAERSVDSALAAILNSTVPLFVLVIAPAFLPDEPIRLNGVIGLAVGFAGVILLVSPGLVSASGDPAGELAMLASSVAYACGNVYSRRNVRGLPALIPAVFQVSIAFLIVVTLAIILEQPWTTATPDAQAWFSVLWLGIIGSGFAYLAYFHLLRSWGATRTALVAYTLPVVGIILGYLVLDESIDAALIVGTGLIIGGVALVNGRWGRRRLFARTPPVEPA